MHRLPVGGGQFGEQRRKVGFFPVLAAEQALQVAFVAPVERHHEDVVAGKAACFSGDGIAFFAVGRAVADAWREDFRQLRRRFCPHGRLPIRSGICRTNEVFPHRAAVGVAVKTPCQHRRFQVGGEEAANSGLCLACLRRRRAVLDTAHAGVDVDGCHHVFYGGVVVFFFARGEQFVFRPPPVFDLPHRVHQPAQFVHGQRLPRLALQLIQHLRRDVRLDALLALRLHPFGKRLSAVERLAGLVAQVVAFEQRLDLFALLDGNGFWIEFVHAAQIQRVLFRLYFRLVGGAGKRGLQDLIAFFCGSGGDVALFHRSQGGFGGARFHAGVLRGREVADAFLSDGLRRQLPCRALHQTRAAAGLGERVVFGRQHAQAQVVVRRHVRRIIDGFRCRQFAVALQHDAVGKIAHGGFRFGRGEQRLHQRVAGIIDGVAVGIHDQLRQQVGMDAAFFLHFAAEGGNLRVVVTHLRQAGIVQAKRGQVVQVRVFSGFADTGVWLVAVAVLRVAAPLRLEKFVEVVEAVALREVAVLHERLPHAVEALSAFAAQHEKARFDRADFVGGVKAPGAFDVRTVDAAQFGNGGKEVVVFRRNVVRPRPLVAGDGGIGVHFARQHLPDAIDRLRHDGVARLDFCFAVQDFRLFVFRLQRLVFQATNRLGIGEHPQAHFIQGGVARPLKLTLVVGELLRRHPRRFRRGKQRHHRTVLLGDLYRLIAGKHPVEHLAHVVVECDAEAAPVAINGEQPGAGAREDALQLHVGRLARHQVGFKLFGDVLVMTPALFQRHLVPVVQRKLRLAQQGIGVFEQADFALGERATTGGVVAGAQVVGDAGQGFKVEMPQLVDEGGEVGFLQERNGVGRWIEGAAFAVSIGVLVQRVVGEIPCRAVVALGIAQQFAYTKGKTPRGWLSRSLKIGFRHR